MKSIVSSAFYSDVYETFVWVYLPDVKPAALHDCQMSGVREDVVKRAHHILTTHRLQQFAAAAEASLALQQMAAHWAEELQQLDAFACGSGGGADDGAAAAVRFLLQVAHQAGHLVKIC